MNIFFTNIAESTDYMCYILQLYYTFLSSVHLARLLRLPPFSPSTASRTQHLLWKSCKLCNAAAAAPSSDSVGNHGEGEIQEEGGGTETVVVLGPQVINSPNRWKVSDFPTWCNPKTATI